MADQEHVHFDPARCQNGPTEQHQHSFNSPNFQDLVLEAADFGPLHEDFFDSAGILPALQGSDSLPPTGGLEAFGEGDHLIEGHFGSTTQYPQVANDHAPIDFDNGVQDFTPHSQDLESIIPNNYGFGYWLSVCSRPGIAWVHQKVKADEFAEIAEDLKASWAKQMRLEHTQPASKSAEPETQLAWKYCNAYFEHSVDNLWETVHRPDFERLLRAHLSGKIQYHDPSWYALRNVVYAAGCRIYRSEYPEASSTDVQKEAWGYFSNSLSVHSELLLIKPTLRSVRALLTMAFFAEGLASPALSSGLASNAALLAQSLGLHRKRVDVDIHAHSEALQRSWLFWAVYCCEKHIAQRCGQPSLIDDDEITCEIPTTVHPGSAIDLEMLTYIIQTCQFYARVSKQLLTTRALHEPPEKMLSLVRQFDVQLQTWRGSMPSQLQPTEFLKQFKMPRTMRLLGLMTAHCSFYDLLMVVHSIFMYPWVIDSFSGNADPEVARRIKAQIITSSNLVANAARSLIVITRSLDMESIGTQSFTLYFPMRAFVNLFVYVIENPQLPSVHSDLALLDVAAGYFGQMEFVTGSKVSFPFARDIAALARNVVDEAQNPSPKPSTQIPHEFQMNEMLMPNQTQHLQMLDLDFDSWIS